MQYNAYRHLTTEVRAICGESTTITDQIQNKLVVTLQEFVEHIALVMRRCIDDLLGPAPPEERSAGATDTSNLDKLQDRIIEICPVGRPIDDALGSELEKLITSYVSLLRQRLHKSVTLVVMPGPEERWYGPPPVKPLPSTEPAPILPKYLTAPTNTPPTADILHDGGEDLPTDPGAAVIGEVDPDLMLPNGDGEGDLGDLVSPVAPPTEEPLHPPPAFAGMEEGRTGVIRRQPAVIAGTSGEEGMVVRRQSAPAAPSQPQPPLLRGVPDEPHVPDGSAVELDVRGVQARLRRSEARDTSFDVGTFPQIKQGSPLPQPIESPTGHHDSEPIKMFTGATPGTETTLVIPAGAPMATLKPPSQPETGAERRTDTLDPLQPKQPKVKKPTVVVKPRQDGPSTVVESIVGYDRVKAAGEIGGSKPEPDAPQPRPTVKTEPENHPPATREPESTVWVKPNDQHDAGHHTRPVQPSDPKSGKKK